MLKFENCSNGRFYYIDARHDLFGDLILHIVRGGTGVSVINILFVGNENNMRKQIDRLSRLRLRRGYTLVN